MFVFDVETLAFLDANEAAVRRYGWSREEFLGMTILDIRPPEDVPRLLDVLPHLGTHGMMTPPGPWRHRRKDGLLLDVMVSQHLIDFAGRCARVVLVQDVTAARRTEDALRESENRYRLLAETTPVGIWHITPTGRTLYANPAMCKMLEIESVEDLLTASAFDFIAPEHRERQRAEHAKRAYNIASSWEADLIGRRGGRRSVVVSGAPIMDAKGRFESMIGTIIDLTERKRTEAALAAKTRVFDAMINSISDGVVVSDEHGKFILYNPAAVQIAGIGIIEDSSPERWQKDYGIYRWDGKTPYPTDELPLVRAIRGASTDQAELFLRNTMHPEGVFLSVSGRTVRDETGAARGGVVVFCDMTERKKLEEEFHKLRKMDAIGRIAAGVAHDFGTLATAIRLYARAMLKDARAPRSPRRDLEQIMSAAEHAIALSRRLMNFSGGAVAVPGALDMDEALAQLDPLLRSLMTAGIVLELRRGAARPHVAADHMQIEQVLLNLVVNARDAMPSGGRLTIETTNVSLDEAQARQRGLAGGGAYVLLAVTDTGTGMDGEVQSHVFEPYFTTKPFGEGTGLGLFTAYGIVRQLCGHISMRSALGAGSRFEVLLPCASAAPPVERKAAKPARKDARGGRRRRRTKDS